jgi:adenine-specific DNA-methyltransferase
VSFQWPSILGGEWSSGRTLLTRSLRTVADPFRSLLWEAESRRLALASKLDANRRVELGQFLTPAPVASFMASLLDLTPGPREARLLDPGAGAGSLAAATIDRWVESGQAGTLHVTAVEVDEVVRANLLEVMSHSAEAGVSVEVVPEDFVAWGSARAGLGMEAATFVPFDFCIMNPPYRKIAARSVVRQTLQHVGVEVPNLYAAFVALGIRLLAPGGQLVAITPRSFANGPYFRDFRRDLLSKSALKQIHVFDRRDLAFADDDVLQENVIILAVRDGPVGRVKITSSASVDAEVVTREVDQDDVVRPGDPNRFIHLVIDGSGDALAARMSNLPCSPGDLGLTVSTGKVVDFRTKGNLHAEAEDGDAPLIYPNHFDRGRIRWPQQGGRKPNGLAVNEDTKSLLLPNGCYVLVKRFSAKEETRRIVAAVVEANDLPGRWLAFENHLNVFHESQQPVERSVAIGLATFLNSTFADDFFRQWSGHTQVNATDLRSMRYPDLDALRTLGDAAGVTGLSQEKVDALVADLVPGLGEVPSP